MMRILNYLHAIKSIPSHVVHVKSKKLSYCSTHACGSEPCAKSDHSYTCRLSEGACMLINDGRMRFCIVIVGLLKRVYTGLN